MTGEEFEAALLAEAQQGDLEARRQLLSIAIDALRRNVAMSDGLRSFLADGLALVQLAADPYPNEPIATATALVGFGYEKAPAHRAKSGEVEQEQLEILAFVHLLCARGVGKSDAVATAAVAASKSEDTVWRKCKDSEWIGDDATAAKFADRLFMNAKLAYSRNAKAFSKEVIALLASDGERLV